MYITYVYDCVKNKVITIIIIAILMVIVLYLHCYDIIYVVLLRKNYIF